MEEARLIEAVEKYISGQMSPDERVYFEQLRKTNPDVDQAVVEHTFFLQQLNRCDEVRKLKSNLSDIHIDLAEKGLIQSSRLQGKARVIYLYNKYKRVAASAASIAGITALAFTALLSQGKPANKQDIMELSRDIKTIDQKVNAIQKKNYELEKNLNVVQDQATTLPPIEYKSGGTGFLIDVKGYIATNAHVVKDAQHIAVQTDNGTEITAKVIYMNHDNDIAILKLTGKNYKAPSSIPYSIKKSSGDLAERIFTLGYPRNDIVYGDGYIASKTGYNGDTLSCQITIPANRGNSGSPIFNKNGEVIGILSKKEQTAEGVAFAIRSKYIYTALSQLQKDPSNISIKPPTSTSLKGVDRTQQVRRISDYVYLVKVD